MFLTADGLIIASANNQILLGHDHSMILGYHAGDPEIQLSITFSILDQPSKTTECSATLKARKSRSIKSCLGMILPCHAGDPGIPLSLKFPILDYTPQKRLNAQRFWKPENLSQRPKRPSTIIRLRTFSRHQAIWHYKVDSSRSNLCPWVVYDFEGATFRKPLWGSHYDVVNSREPLWDQNFMRPFLGSFGGSQILSPTEATFGGFGTISDPPALFYSYD